ncbi:Protein of unknown function [Variovorax sp. YR216]|nr:Protein of unknown function [Variovorax sp. YR216]
MVPRDIAPHLKRREMERVCQYGACARMHNLTLKFVAHSGPCSTMTQDTLDQVQGESVPPPDFESGSNQYDEIGEVVYRHHSMTGYLSELPSLN